MKQTRLNKNNYSSENKIMKKLTFLILLGIMGTLFARNLSAQEIAVDYSLSETASSTSRGIKSVNALQTKGTILDSMQLLQTRYPLGVTVVNDTIIISSADGKGNNYFDTYDFSGKHLSSAKQPGTTKWGYRDLAFDGQYILASEDTNIRKVSPHTFAVVSSISNKGNSIHRGLAYDSGENAIYSTNLSGSHLLKINAATGKTIKDYGKLPIYRNPYGLAFDPYTMPGMASLWLTTPAYFNYFELTRVDTARGESNFIYDFSGQLPDSCFVGGLDIVNNVAKYPKKVVALELDQHNKKLYFMDITQAPNNLPISMEQVGFYDGSDDNVTNITTGFVVYDKYLYAIRNNKLAIYQIDTDPAHPKLLKSVDVSFPNKIFLHGKNLFVSTGDKEMENTTGLTIFSLEDPLNPVLKSTVNTGGHVMGMTFVGKYAYLVQRGDVKLKSLDISDISHPAFSTEYTLPYGGLAIGSDTAAKLVFASFTKYEGSDENGFSVLNVSGMPATIHKIYEYNSNFAYVSFVSLDGKVLAALGNDAQQKRSYVGFWHYTASACTQELNDYFTVCDTATADHMGLIGGTTILVSVPGEKRLKSYGYDTELKKRFFGPTLKLDMPSDFVWYTPSGKKEAGVPSIDNTSDFTANIYTFVGNGMSMGGTNWLSDGITVIKLKAPPKKAKKVTLSMEIKPSQAKFDGCTTEPSAGQHQYDLHTINPETPSLIAHGKPDKGWYFKEWTGDASGKDPHTVVQMDGDKTVTANFVNLSLYIHGSQAKRIICPDSVKKWQLQMLPIRLTASDDDDWVVTAVKIKTSGNGNEKADIKKVFLYKGDNKLGTATFSSDNEKLSISLDNGLTIPAGSTVNLSLGYLFKIDTLHYAGDTVRTFLVSTNGVTAKPKHYEAGWISGTATADTLFVARVINKNKSRGFTKIQEAISSPVTKDGDTIFVCNGKYEENVAIDKSIKLIGKNREHTIIEFPDAEIQPYGINVVSTNNVVIENFTIKPSPYIPHSKSLYTVISINPKFIKGITSTEFSVLIRNNIIMGPLVSKFVTGIDGTGLQNSLITGNYFHLIDGAVQLSGSTGCTLSLNEIDYAGIKTVVDGGLSLDNSHTCSINSNYFHNLKEIHLSYEVIRVRNSFNTTLKYNTSDNIAKYIIMIVGSNENLIMSNKNFELTFFLDSDNNKIINNVLRGIHKIIDDKNEFTRFSNSEISKNIIKEGSEEGIFLVNPEKVIISKNRIYHMGYYGIKLDGGMNVIIQENRIWDCIGDGIEVKSGRNISIVDNYLWHNTFTGIEMNSVMNYNIDDNVLRSNCTGIKITHSVGGKVRMNQILNNLCTLTGLHIGNSSPQVFNNSISNNNGNGIFTENRANPLIKHNNISGNAAHGVNNCDPNIKINAQHNWWGNPGGPSVKDAVGNIDASNWMTGAGTLSVSAQLDTLWITPGSSDSVFCSVANWADSLDRFNITFSDTKKWLTGAKQQTTSFKDSLLGGVYAHLTVPAGIQEGTTEWVKMQVVSQKSSQTVADSFVLVTYTKKLSSINIYPDSATILNNDSMQFSTRGFDQYNRLYGFVPHWTCSAGHIDSTGKYKPNGASGIVTVTVTDNNSGKQKTASVYVASKTPVLKRILLNPDTVKLSPGRDVLFEAKGYNQYGFPAGLALQWTAQGGTIDQSGYYRADSTAGTFQITAKDTLTGISQTAVVIIENATGIATQNVTNEGLVLSQNYPNPFQTKTQISFTLSKAATVRLSVFDMTGREVTRLVNAKKPAGHYTVVFHASGLPAGTYFYRLQAGRSIQLKKMILLK
jgi:hypothetical protein